MKLISLLMFAGCLGCSASNAKRLNVYIDSEDCSCVAIIPDKNTPFKKIEDIHIDSSCYYRINHEQALSYNAHEIVVFHQQVELKINTQYHSGDSEVFFHGKKVAFKMIRLNGGSDSRCVALSDTLLNLDIQQ